MPSIHLTVDAQNEWGGEEREREMEEQRKLLRQSGRKEEKKNRGGKA